MTDRVFPSSKPPTTKPPPTTANGTTTATVPPPPIAASTNPPAAATTKSNNLYNPTSRPPYRPQPYGRGGARRHSRRSARRLCCCCCLWTTIVLLIILLLAATAGAALYILYHPHRPEFTVPSLRIHRLNLTTTDATSSSGHLSSLLNLTIVGKNPNSHIEFAYDTFTITSFTSSSDVLLGNATLPGFAQGKKNVTTLRNVVVSGSSDLDAESVNSLRSDLKKKFGNGSVILKIKMDTKVTVTVGKAKSKRIGIRVTCDDIIGTVPKGKSPTLAVTTGSKCKVDLRIKLWKFTF